MKKNIFLLFAIALIISLLASCKKDPLDAIGDDEARMYGKIVEKGSKKPIKGARVYLRNCKCILLGGCSCKVIDSLTTDDTGRYDFTYKYRGFDGRSFDIFVRVPNGAYLQENSPAALSPNMHDVVNYDVEIQTLGWVKARIRNINPYDEFDFIWINGLTNISSDFRLYGKDIDTTTIQQRLGNDSTGIGWEMKKNNLSTFKQKKVYISAHDTTYFELLY